MFSFASCSAKGNPLDYKKTETEHFEEFISGDDYITREYYTLTGYTHHFWPKAKTAYNFVHYDLLKSLGNFDGCLLYLDSVNKKDNRYTYTLTDATGYEYRLTIYTDKGKRPYADLWSSFETPADGLTDMRECNSCVECTHVVNNIAYKYDESGLLLYICWLSDSLYFQLYLKSNTHVRQETLTGYNYIYSNEGLRDYDMESGTFLSKMLNSETAEQTAAELNKTIERKLAWNRFALNAGVPILIAIIVLVAACIFIHIHKTVKRMNSNAQQALLKTSTPQQDTIPDQL